MCVCYKYSKSGSCRILYCVLHGGRSPCVILTDGSVAAVFSTTAGGAGKA